jgi:hypothetical protein
LQFEIRPDAKVSQVKDSPNLAQYNPNLGSRGINLNSQVNWSNPNQTSALLDGNPYNYLALGAMAAREDIPSMTANQFMDLVIAHELSHSFGEQHEADVGVEEFDKNIWRSCFQ